MKTMNFKILVVLAMAMICNLKKLQAQAGDICSNAISVNLQNPILSPCASVNLTGTGYDFSNFASNTAPGVLPSCNYGSSNNDFWLRITLPAQSDGFNISINDVAGSSNDYRNFSLAIYTGSGCNTLSYVSCQRGSQLNYVRYFDGFGAGQTVWARIYRDASPSGTYTDPFSIQLAATNTSGSNDACQQAAPLIANTYCNNSATGKNEPSSKAPDNLTGTNNVCGSSGFGTFENNQWYYFEVGPGTNQPVSVSLSGVNCSGTNSLLQTALWKTSAFNCNTWATSTGYNLTNATAAGDGFLIGCAVGTGSVNITKNLPLGRYWFTVDGSRGSFCRYTINTSPAILPISFLYFSTKESVDRSTIVEWTITKAQEIKSFVIEGSSDGFTFFPISTIQNHQSGTSNFTYQMSVNQGYTYVRIAALYTSGQKEFSDISQIVEIEKKPNVTYHLESKSWLIYTPKTDNTELKLDVFNVQGSLIQSFSLLQTNEFITQNHTLPPGVYIYQLVTQRNSLQGKIYVE